MTEEKKPIVPAPVRHYDKKKHLGWCRGPASCLCKSTTANLTGEAARISRSTTVSKLDGAIADILLITVFKKNVKGNDPYMTEKRSSKTKFLDLHKNLKAT